MAGGRKTKLDAALIQRAVDLKMRHLPISRIAPALAISETTWFRWLREAEDEDASDNDLQRQFRQSLEKAEAEEQVEIVSKHPVTSSPRSIAGALANGSGPSGPTADLTVHITVCTARQRICTLDCN